MLFITGTLWGWVEARPEKQGLMTVVSYTMGGVWLLCSRASERVIMAGLSSQGDFGSCFSGVPLVSVIMNRFHACENKVGVWKMYSADKYLKTISDFQCLFLCTCLGTSIGHFPV